jgi:hypothetical protein
MNFFAPQTEAVDLGDGNTVILRKLTYGEIVAAMDDPKWEKSAGKVIAERSLVSWDGPGFDGKPATPENFAALPWPVAIKIVKASNNLTNLSTDEGEGSGVGTS